MLFVGTSIIHPSTEGVFLLCNILDLLIYSYMFKKAFWVPYEDSANYPTLAKTMEAISKYCEENGKSYTFINDDEVEINGKRYEIYRGYENGSRGNYGIKCKEK